MFTFFLPLSGPIRLPFNQSNDLYWGSGERDRVAGILSFQSGGLGEVVRRHKVWNKQFNHSLSHGGINLALSLKLVEPFCFKVEKKTKITL